MKLRLISEITVADPDTALRLGRKLAGQIGDLTVRPALKLVKLEKVYDEVKNLTRLMASGKAVSRNNLNRFKRDYNQLRPKDQQRLIQQLDQQERQRIGKLIDQEYDTNPHS